MSFLRRYRTPYFTGSSQGTASVPTLFPVALDGRGFLLDNPASSPRFQHSTVPVTSPNMLTADELGERSLNAAAGWRRSQSSWHGGAGQSELDGADSTRTRFRSSRGVDVWDRHQLSLLPATGRVKTTTAAAPLLETTADRVWLANGMTLEWSDADLDVWRSMAMPAPITSMATDGYTLWLACGASGIYEMNPVLTAPRRYNPLAADRVAFARGRLLATKGAALYNVTSATEPAPLFTAPSTEWRWTGFAEGEQVIYAAGVLGDRSLIYRIGLLEDASGLAQPIVAARLPDGELVTAVGAYLGTLVIGTSSGVRLALQGQGGALTVGAFIPTGAVRCFEPQDRFVWFGWSNYDLARTGLGRLDLTTLNDSAPAWASDLMAEGTQGQVTSVVTFAGRRVFAVAGSGVWRETTDLVPDGELLTGSFSFDLPDAKMISQVQVRRTGALVGSHQLYVVTDDQDEQALGERIGQATGPYFGRQIRGESFELRHVLVCDPVRKGRGPVLSRWTMTAHPALNRPVTIDVPLLLAETLELLNGTTERRNVAQDRDFLEALCRSQRVVTYQEAGVNRPVVLTDYQLDIGELTRDGRGFTGTFLARLTSQEDSGR